MCGEFISKALDGVSSAVGSVVDAVVAPVGGAVTGAVQSTGDTVTNGAARVTTSEGFQTVAKVAATSVVGGALVAAGGAAFGVGEAGAGAAGAGEIGVAGAGETAVAGAGTEAASSFSLADVVGGIKTAAGVVNTAKTIQALTNGPKPVVPTAGQSFGDSGRYGSIPMALPAQSKASAVAGTPAAGAGAAVVAQSKEMNYLPLIAAGVAALAVMKG